MFDFKQVFWKLHHLLLQILLFPRCIFCAVVLFFGKRTYNHKMSSPHRCFQRSSFLQFLHYLLLVPSIHLILQFSPVLCNHLNNFFSSLGYCVEEMGSNLNGIRPSFNLSSYHQDDRKHKYKIYSRARWKIKSWNKDPALWNWMGNLILKLVCVDNFLIWALFQLLFCIWKKLSVLMGKWLKNMQNW